MSTALPTERTAVITGAASRRGIGQAAAHRLARDGWAVAILDLDGSAAEATATRIAETYGVPSGDSPWTSLTRVRSIRRSS